MWPCSEYECRIHRSSNRLFDPEYDDSAKSDLDMVAVYSDTLDDPMWVWVEEDGRPHVPLNLMITQSSYSWSADYAQDFILIDYSIQNIGKIDLERVYLGFYVVPSIFHESKRTTGPFEDICGFRETYPSIIGQGYLDTIDIAWSADNDGDPSPGGVYDYSSVTSITGLRILRSPAEGLRPSFNWFTWIEESNYSWGPMLEDNKRQFETGGQGYPAADRERYYLLANGECDYDKIFANEDRSSEGWLPPSPSMALQLARGVIGTQYVLSVGPFDIPAGTSVPLTIGYIGGEGFHRFPDAYKRHMDVDFNPEVFCRTLDFDDLAENAVRADWVFDNPGFDTDGDGYAGPYWEIVDTLPNGEIVIEKYYYAGDGVPDFRPATPPPAPVVRYSTSLGTVKLKWNGLVTETAVDPFTGIVDFEGYRVYMGRLNRIDHMALVASHDICDFSRLAWNEERSFWQRTDSPIRLVSLRQIYGEDFDPVLYPCGSRGDGYLVDSTVCCFKPVDYNQTIAGWDDGGIPGKQEFRKTYIDEIAAGLISSEIDIDDTLTSNNWIRDINPLTGDSIYYHKYYEYEFVMDDLLPSVPWYFSVTAFDFGDPSHNIEPLESSPIANSVETWAISDASYVLREDLQVMVYPNPYIGDGSYIDAGYEDPNRTGFVDHERRIHFLNLPPSCTVRIYTISGDHVRDIEHPGYYSSNDSKLTWDMRSSNNELVTSGIYLFVVESDWGTQIGKIVVIL
jgi:hypothetical protein